MFLLKYKKRIFNLVTILFFILFFVNIVLANADTKKTGIGKAGGKDSELETFGKGAGYATTGEGADIDVIIGNVIKIILSFLGVIFLVLLVYGGFLWMQARGDSDQVNKAKETMINASIGLVIVLGAYSITVFIVSNLTSSTLK